MRHQQAEQHRIWHFTSLVHVRLLNIEHGLNRAIDYHQYPDIAFLNLDFTSRELIRLDATIRSFDSWINSLLNINWLGNFESIANLLSEQKWDMQGSLIHGIQVSDTISENEVIFLTRLRDDLNTIMYRMTQEEINRDKMHEILSDFFREWQWQPAVRSSEPYANPFRLLQYGNRPGLQ